MAKKSSTKVNMKDVIEAAMTQAQSATPAKREIYFNDAGDVEFADGVLPITIDYEVRDTESKFLVRNPLGEFVRNAVANGDQFVEAGPSRIVSFHPQLADVSKNAEAKHPNGISGRIIFYFNGRNQLHRDGQYSHPRLNGGKPIAVKPGPAVEFDNPELAQHFNLYALEGIPLNEEGIEIARKIVETPEKLTVNDIHNIKNEEIRRIALQKMGEDRYVLEANAKVIDEGYNTKERTYEVLLTTDKFVFMNCACPSTARTYLIRVPRTVKTRKEARAYMNNGLSDEKCVGRT